MGMFRDKDYRKVIRKTEKYADTILTIAAPDNPQGSDPAGAGRCGAGISF